MAGMNPGQVDVGESKPLLHARHAAVTSDAASASAAGVDALRAGGNAADAACATAAALGVVDPFASGLGGGGFALVRLANGQTLALDFRESAPALLRSGSKGGIVISRQSGRSVGVPGEPAGLAELVRRFGALPFSRCLEPALRLARGFTVSPALARQIREELDRNPGSGPDLIAQLFGIDRARAARLAPGERVSRPALARTLARLQREGAAAFYRGDLAKAMVAATTAAGGVLGLADLRAYATVERKPLVSDFLGHQVLTLPPPSAGGVMVAQALGILASRATDLRHSGMGSADTLHLLAEALKHVFADRARFLGDPGYVTMPLDHLLDPHYQRELAQGISIDHVLAHDSYGTPAHAPTSPARDAGTAHISVIDQDGNAVALTTTINLSFGARIVAGDTGILLNDELDDFTLVADGKDVFAIAGGEANFPAPGKRPLSSMSPTIVVGEQGVELVTGAAGGPRIASATLQVLVAVLVQGLAAGAAVVAPRIHHQWDPDILFYEPGISAATVHALERKGHVCAQAADLGKANLIIRTPTGLDAAADPRAGGAAAGY